MFLLYSLDTYINSVKYLQEFQWMYPLTGVICIKILKKLIQKYQRWDHTGSIQKEPTASIWKRILETLWLWKNNQRRPQKLSVQQNRNILRQTKYLQEEMGNFFVKKSNGKSRYYTIH